jgi:hypothetical protein
MYNVNQWKTKCVTLILLFQSRNILMNNVCVPQSNGEILENTFEVAWNISF